MSTFLFLSLLTFSAFAKDRQVEVSGECLKTVSSDRGSVDLISVHLNPDSKVAFREATKLYESLRDQLKKLNLKDLELETTESQLFEEKAWENNKTVSKGFRARLGLNVSTSEISRLGEVIAVAAKLKIKEITNLQTFASRELLKRERETCLEEAAKNARAKAEKLVKALGARVGEVLIIQELPSGSSTPRPPIMAMKVMAAMDAAESMPTANIEGKSNKIEIHVMAAFAVN